MVHVKIDYDFPRKKGIIISDYLPNIREHFSVEDKQQVFKRRHAIGYRPQTRQYCITPQGRFEPRMVFSIIEFLQKQDISLNLEITDQFKNVIAVPHLLEEIIKLNLDPRDYQQEAVQSALKYKSGVIVLPTSAGKTLVIALLVKSIQAQYNSKALILVPDIQLVAQTYSDFIEYGINEKEITKLANLLGFDMKDAKYGPYVNQYIDYYNINLADFQTILEKIKAKMSFVNILIYNDLLS
jgi:hypothetical protein